MRTTLSAALLTAALLTGCQATKPQPEPDTRVIVLEYVQAEDLATTLVQFLQQDVKSGKSDLRVECAKAQNALLVSGTPERVDQVLKLIAQLDTKPTERNG